MKTETIRKGPVMRSRLMPGRLKEDRGETDWKGERGTVLLLPAAGMDAYIGSCMFLQDLPEFF